MVELRWLGLVSLALILGGCAAQAPEPAFDAHFAEVTATAAAQVRRCYRSPRVSYAGRQIITRLRVRYAPDGTLAGLPSIVAQSGLNATNQTYATPMAEAAITAVLKCSPLHLPPEYYAKGWNEFELTFSPQASV